MVQLQNELLALTDPANGKVALGVRDAKTIADTEIRVRGEAEKLGPIVPRGFLSVLQVADVPKINPSQSGRLELAQWLASEQNPLTPARDGQPGLAASFRQGLGAERRQFRRDRRRAIAPGAARLPGGAVRSRRLVGQEAGAERSCSAGPIGLGSETCRKPTLPSTRPTG